MVKIKWPGIPLLTLLVILCLIQNDARAERYGLFGGPLDLYGRLSQNVAYGWQDEFDTEKGINAAIWTALFEGDYRPSDELKLFGQFIFTGDFIYELKSSDSSWEEKRFDRSRRELSFDDRYWQIAKELHATWTPGPFLFRMGKQIISWGQTDGIRLMDQINPQDLRRGFADVAFETTIIPIWMLRADYSPPIESTRLQDLSFQLWFNPNADFIPTQNIAPGNDASGIWAPYAEIPVPFPGKTLLGSAESRIDRPEEWSEGHEFGFRAQGVLHDTLLSFNAFYGRENDPILLAAGPPALEFDAAPGINLLHPRQEGFFPLLRFVGGTLSRDLTFLRKALGGVSPVLRLETFYAFDSTFVESDPVSGIDRLEEHDELRWAAGFDWKIRVPALSPSGIVVGPQFFHRHVFDLPSGQIRVSPTGVVEKNNYTSTLLLKTAYMNERLPVSLFWLRDITNRAGFFKPSVSYLWDKHWTIETGALFFGGDKKGESFEVFGHKDYLYMTVSYKWG